ncbi:hypothetical protein LSH36_900g00014 [Paralvinella palmiformis]|uniref:Galactosyltransferase N-terminal domain-containing protein n=1 Tax=Paralvinella palmiformis TaxID=53620 RepID=A0AAD9IYF5_9ANNE|nr:hypothetical protein LSH36_900g00014 [Paralvinella palmiformis]
MNIGYLEAVKLFNMDCVLFHDVDTLIERDDNMVICGDKPVHFAAYTDRHNYKYGVLFGVLNETGDLGPEYSVIIIIIVCVCVGGGVFQYTCNKPIKMDILFDISGYAYSLDQPFFYREKYLRSLMASLTCIMAGEEKMMTLDHGISFSLSLSLSLSLSID